MAVGSRARDRASSLTKEEVGMGIEGRQYTTILSAYLASKNGTEGAVPWENVGIEGEEGGESGYQDISGRHSVEQSIRWGQDT